MHLLAAQPGSISDGSAALDLGQAPGDIVFLSSADTELACLAAAQDRLGPDAPSLRLANLLQLGHNLSIDLYLDKVVLSRPAGDPSPARRNWLLVLWHRTARGPLPEKVSLSPPCQATISRTPS